jgi:hypothetical protein
LICDCVEDVDSSEVLGRTVTLRSFLRPDIVVLIPNDEYF